MWDPEYLESVTPEFNPWPIKYLLPVYKWWPLYWPNEEWEVVSGPPSFPREAPQPPEGLAIPWWKASKDMWPYQTPFEPKVFGAWPASQISTPNDLQNNPPFGLIKLKVPGESQTSGNQIAFTQMKMHMRYLSITQMKVTTIVTPFGPKFYIKSENWNQHEKQAAEIRAAMKRKWRDKLAEQIVGKIEETEGQPGLIAERLAEELIKIEEKTKPSKDLFS